MNLQGLKFWILAVVILFIVFIGIYYNWLLLKAPFDIRNLQQQMDSLEQSVADLESLYYTDNDI